MTDKTNNPARPRDVSAIALSVDHVDAMGRELSARGVTLLNGPTDQPCGLRTAGFRDPGCHIREIAP
ncbi:VOC family protein [Streptomyces sp. NPDC056352]|uniref:VOC family protein n=1 Tax=Streptomyces sp. NPDC056352 TaxID=3345791 RepID=UPI0035E1AF70